MKWTQPSTRTCLHRVVLTFYTELLSTDLASQTAWMEWQENIVLPMEIEFRVSYTVSLFKCRNPGLNFRALYMTTYKQRCKVKDVCVFGVNGIGPKPHKRFIHPSIHPSLRHTENGRTLWPVHTSKTPYCWSDKRAGLLVDIGSV